MKNDTGCYENNIGDILYWVNATFYKIRFGDSEELFNENLKKLVKDSK